MALRHRLAVLGGGAFIALFAAACGGSDNEQTADLVNGKQQFVEKCGACHTMARAETTGTSGPNLDEAFRQGLADGFGRDGIEGAVQAQIDNPARLDPDNPAYMPPDLVKGDAARDVSAYVAESVARPGEDTGLLAEAVEKPGSGKPAVAKDGVLSIDSTAQLAYVTSAATAKAGRLVIESPNPSATPHNIAIEGPGGVSEIGEVVQDGGVSRITVNVKKGAEYTFFCTVAGHREGGMEGQLKVE